ncbi:MAG: hydroxyacid dehydrogenase [Anaerolineae bacterium]|nr:hydroxyacid dehydrogenase [Anaerolineae bacterium]
MTKYNILIADGLKDIGQALLSSSASVEDRTDIASHDLLNEIKEYDALIVRSRTKVTPQVFEAAKKLKVVGRAGVGVDNIDLAAAQSHNVTVVNSPTATSLAVAELTLGLMLGLVREISRGDAGMKQANWLKKDLAGAELFGKTLGIIGMGRIGAEVGLRASAFGMTILGYDPLIQAEEIQKRGALPVSLDELYIQADHISLHLPLTDETRSMVNQQAFAKMKRGVRIVCAARGGIIDESALLSALESGIVAGAGLDVFATEPPGASGLVNHPKVIATPHIGAQTEEAQARAAEDIANEVLAALAGQPLRWKVV